MNETIGVIGQKYEDRKSKKVGTLLDRDVENKKLSFLDENAEPFQVSYAAFKSNWRKVIAETPVETVAEAETQNEVVEETVDSSYESMTEVDPDTKPEVEITPWTEDDKIKDFVKALTNTRVGCVDVTPTTCTVMVDDVTVCAMEKVADGYKMSMLPDIFIFAEWGDVFKAGDVHFNIKHGRHRGVCVDCVKASIGDILQFIKTAAVEINLYGYIN
jgi:hypothetical protein